jgi:hypothetical protein
MEANGDEFVPQEVLEVLEGLAEAMTNEEWFVLHFLHHFFNHASITIPLLLLAGYLSHREVTYCQFYFEFFKEDGDFSPEEEEHFERMEGLLENLRRMVALFKKGGLPWQG